MLQCATLSDMTFSSTFFRDLNTARDGKEGDWSVVQKEGKVADAATVPTCPRGPFSRCGRMTERSTLADSAFSEGTLSVELQPDCGTHVAGGRRPVNARASSSLQYL